MPVNTEQRFSDLVKGKICVEVSRLEYEHEGTVSPCTVVFMRVGPDKWLRFFFDAGVFFWRLVETPDETRKENGFLYRVVGVPEATPQPQEIQRALFKGSEGDPVRALLLEFQNGSKLRLVNAKDENALFIE